MNETLYRIQWIHFSRLIKYIKWYLIICKCSIFNNHWKNIYNLIPLKYFSNNYIAIYRLSIWFFQMYFICSFKIYFAGQQTHLLPFKVFYKSGWDMIDFSFVLICIIFYRPTCTYQYIHLNSWQSFKSQNRKKFQLLKRKLQMGTF